MDFYRPPNSKVQAHLGSTWRTLATQLVQFLNPHLQNQAFAPLGQFGPSVLC